MNGFICRGGHPSKCPVCRIPPISSTAPTVRQFIRRKLALASYPREEVNVKHLLIRLEAGWFVLLRYAPICCDGCGRLVQLRNVVRLEGCREFCPSCAEQGKERVQ